jgi:hypothetical protein
MTTDSWLPRIAKAQSDAFPVSAICRSHRESILPGLVHARKVHADPLKGPTGAASHLPVCAVLKAPAPIAYVAVQGGCRNP